jgi:hypothetical protein
LIEQESREPEAEELRRDLIPWLQRVGAFSEVEPDEVTLLSAPLGTLDRKTEVNATWRSEGMVVLAWALQCVELPQVHVECDVNSVADTLGFLGDRYETPLPMPRLRDAGEIEHYANRCLTLHWRLRQFSIKPGIMDFRAFVAGCKWANLTLQGLELDGDDLAIGGVRIDLLETRIYQHTVSITQERHQAFNWLLGWESVYSEVTTDT